MIERILAETERAVTERMREQSLEHLKARLVPSERSLAKALKKRKNTVILECKKASPSQGVIRNSFDVPEIIRAYEPFADAISVITSSAFFQGDLKYLKIAREFTDKPLLCKDFILSPYQVYEARFFDADAVLLMMSVLDDEAFAACFSAAQSLKLDALVEVHNETELARALTLGAHIIGVNNRDFRTLKVDLTTAERIIPKIPSDKITVFESGISSHEELRDYRELSNAFLIGTSLMRQPDLTRAVRELLFGRVKVCGLTRKEDVLGAHQAGAVFGGLIFAPESPRCISLDRALELIDGSDLRFVGVFVNQSVAQICEYANQLKLAAVQLHGEETAAFIGTLRKNLPSTCEIWKAIRVQESIPTAEEFGCDRILLDAYQSDRRGGTGSRFTWHKLVGLNNKDAYILSGGLSPENAREADAQGLWALDVNSGVESGPGKKDTNLMNAFFEELR